MRTAALIIITPPRAAQRPIRTPGTVTERILAQGVHHSGIIDASRKVVFVDYSGEKIEIVDPRTGEIGDAEIFIAVAECIELHLRRSDVDAGAAGRETKLGLPRRQAPLNSANAPGSRADRRAQTACGFGRTGHGRPSRFGLSVVAFHPR